LLGLVVPAVAAAFFTCRSVSALRADAMTDPAEQLPAVIQSGTLTELPAAHLVPALIADAGDPAAWRYVEFFTANIRNPNTRRAMPGRVPAFSPGATSAG
jgi:hypothetical protein